MGRSAPYNHFMFDYGAVYEDSRLRTTELIRDLTKDQLVRSVPACPDWTATDLIAHVVGVTSDFAAGNVGAAGSDEWTASQIGARRDRSIDELLTEWEETGSMVAQNISSLPRTYSGLLTGDLAVHEQDLRGAVDQPGARDSLAVKAGLDTYAFRFKRKVEGAGLPGVVVTDGDNEWRAGEGEPAATVRGDGFELFRALTGRRTAEEIERLEWTGDPAPFVPVFPLYGTPDHSLGE